MKLEEALSFDKTLKVEKKNASSEFRGICPSGILLKDSISFISKIEHLNILLNSLSSKQGLSTLVLSLKLWQSLKPEELVLLTSSFESILTTPCALMSLTKFSQYFYQEKISADNELVDGRVMGTCDIHPTAEIAQNVFVGARVKISAGVKIHAGSVISSDCEIGENSILYGNVTLYRQVTMGKNCRLHSGSVIGADGFGYHFYEGTHHKIWHYGGVIIEDEVEIGANSCVDGGTFLPTKIGKCSKLDNHVQIGHNVEIGSGVIICGHVAIGGSSKIGAFSVFGGKSAMGDNLSIGKACQVAGGAMINCNWPDQAVLGGHPARPLKEWMRGLAYLRKLSLTKDQKA